MTVEKVNKKIIMSGNVIEYYEYSEGYLKGYTTKTKNGRVKDYKSENYDEHRKQVISRAKKELRRLINSNVGQYGDLTSKFLSVTFGENVKDIKQANLEFKKFIQRLNYDIFKEKKAILKYNVVPEFQERGAIHYHIIFYNLPYKPLKEIQEIWGQGICWINKINQVDNVGAYVAEYMGKDEQGLDDGRLEGKKLYFSSRGLSKPQEITDKKIVETVRAALLDKDKKYTATFDNEHLGNIKYSQYVIKV